MTNPRTDAGAGADAGADAELAGLSETSTALLTDQYELTMLEAALRDGSAGRQCVFEVFARRLPDTRRYGVVAGTARVLQAIVDFTYDADQLAWLADRGVIGDATAQFLSSYRFGGNVDGYAEGELWFPFSPVLTVTGTFADAVLLETVVLSILNHDSAVAGAAARMVSAAGGRPLIEMGSRRTHEQAAMASARAAYLAGFSATSNLAAGRRYGVPTAGTAAHAFTLVHRSERDAFAAQVAALGVGTTLLVDTYDTSVGIATAVEVAGPELGAIRIDSGDLAVMAHQARAQLDALGNQHTKIVVSGDLDEYAIAALAAAPVDSYGAGTQVVVGSGEPTAGMVYKLVEVDGRPVAKRSAHKGGQGGRKYAWRRRRATGTVTEELVSTSSTPPAGGSASDELGTLQHRLMRAGAVVADLPTLADSRQRLAGALVSLPWEGLKLSRGEPAIATTVLGS